MIAALDDDAPRLVWADREGGLRGELVVVQCMLARRDLPRAERHRLRRREAFLLRATRSWKWLDGLADSVRLERGFVEHVQISPSALAERGHELFARAPLVRSIALPTRRWWVSAQDNRGEANVWAAHLETHAAAFAVLPRDRVVHLEVEAMTGDGERTRGAADALTSLIASTPALARLASVVIGGAAIELAMLAPLRDLARVAATFRGGAGAILAALQRMPALARLDSYGNEPQLRGDELAALLAAPEAARLVELELCHNGLVDADVRRIAATPALVRLEQLSLDERRHDPRWGSTLSNAAVRSLAASPHLGALVELQLGCQDFDAATIAALAAAPFAPRLRTLGLRVLEPDAVDALLRGFPALESLHVRSLDDPDALGALRAVIPDVTA